MTPAQLTKPLQIEEFLELAQDDGPQYELVDGILLQMPEPSQLHEEIVGFLDFEFKLQLRLAQDSTKTTRRRNVLVVAPATGRRPDLALITKPERWRESEIEQSITTVPLLVVEVASSNWSNDLVDKQQEYEALGVPEYWIVDYRGQIPAKYCQRGKSAKVISLSLDASGQYQKAEYVGSEVVPCKVFPSLQLTAAQIIQAGDEG